MVFSSERGEENRVGNLAFFKPNFGNFALFSSCWLQKLSLAFWLNFGFFGDSGQFSFNLLHTSLNFLFDLCSKPKMLWDNHNLGHFLCKTTSKTKGFQPELHNIGCENN